MKHCDLVEKARVKLFVKYPIVITELVTYAGEEPDAIGFNGWESCLIECKVTKSDFYVDKKKIFRRLPEYGVGNYRYYLTPKDLLKGSQLPDNWGLYELWGNKVKLIREADRVETNWKNEKKILISALRREPNVGIKYYSNKIKKASISVLEIIKE